MKEPLASKTTRLPLATILLTEPKALCTSQTWKVICLSVLPSKDPIIKDLSPSLRTWPPFAAWYQVPDEDPSDKSYKTWFFSCYHPPKGITNTLDEDCNWRELIFDNAMDTPKTTNTRAVSLTQSHVVLYPDAANDCTWLFTMAYAPSVEGKWHCMKGDHKWTVEAKPSMFGL